MSHDHIAISHAKGHRMSTFLFPLMGQHLTAPLDASARPDLREPGTQPPKQGMTGSMTTPTNHNAPAGSEEEQMAKIELPNGQTLHLPLLTVRRMPLRMLPGAYNGYLQPKMCKSSLRLTPVHARPSSTHAGRRGQHVHRHPQTAAHVRHRSVLRSCRIACTLLPCMQHCAPTSCHGPAAACCS